MPQPQAGQETGADNPPLRLCVYSGGLLSRRLRRILSLAGWKVRLGLPGPGDWVGVWGRSPTARRGEAVAGWRGAPVLRIEDAFLRSVHPGRGGEPPLGLLLDRRGVHFDASAPSDLEWLLASQPLDDPALMTRASDGMARMAAADLSKYNAFDADAPLPSAPYVLVVDQTRGDASIRHSGADAGTFAMMLERARDENPGRRIVIKSHPETAAGLRPGHFGPEHAGGPVTLLATAISPHRLLARAEAVYTVSSQLGFEAILAGHRPRVFGRPFYAGWGLSEDAAGPLPRRGRQLLREQLFAVAMILAPVWHDPFRDRLCRFEEALDTLEALARAWREDRHGYAAWGMRVWKRAALQRFLGRARPVIFAPRRRGGRVPLVWASRASGGAPPDALRVEDGFLRSRGLGAALVPPLSLVLDDLGIHYDPRRESRLERLIEASGNLPPWALARAAALRLRLTATGVTKYNLGGSVPPLPPGHRILVPGQVEDDAAILCGTGTVSRSLDLLRATRRANPGAVLIYKPHPDVEAGLRPGRIAPADLSGLADVVAQEADPAALIAAVDEVWTMTSLLGFEALIRGRPVTCLGLPFYAGWGLTRDLGPSSPRRTARPPLDALLHAALIAYPRYLDPLTGLPCPPEVAVDRLADPRLLRPGPSLRALARLQGWLAAYAWIWR